MIQSREILSSAKVAAIMQPTYLPWAGYFNLIANSDVFVFLDDVQFERRSWQSRNRILVNSEPYLLTVPVHSTCRAMKISEIFMDNDQKWRKKHCEVIRQTYSKHPFFHDIQSIIGIINDESFLKISDLNIAIIKHCTDKLELTSEFKRSQDLNASGKRSEHLLNICLATDCNIYLSPRGSMEYLEEDDVFRKSSVDLIFQDYIPQPYQQLKCQTFISHLSIVDVVANIGWQSARNYVLWLNNDE